MLSIGEKIVYGANGILEIVDIHEESVGDKKLKYYVLQVPNLPGASKTFVPMANEKLIATMRPLLSRTELTDLISRIGEIPLLDWNPDNRARAEEFRAIIDSANVEKIISLIKSVCENGKIRAAEGKKNYLADETFMRKAEKLIFSEFSEVLGMPLSEVRDFIKDNCR